MYLCLQESNSEQFQRIWRRMKKFQEEGVAALSSDHSLHIQMLYQGGYAYLSDLSTYENEKAKGCDLAIMRERFSPLYYGIGFQNNSAYEEVFSNE